MDLTSHSPIKKHVLSNESRVHNDSLGGAFPGQPVDSGDGIASRPQRHAVGVSAQHLLQAVLVRSSVVLVQGVGP